MVSIWDYIPLVIWTPCIACGGVPLQSMNTLQSPKGMQLHLKNSKLPTVKAVYCFDASSIFICQNPDLRSKQEKCPTPTKLSKASCILGRG